MIQNRSARRCAASTTRVATEAVCLIWSGTGTRVESAVETMKPIAGEFTNHRKPHDVARQERNCFL
jgi:hypothetical protein